MCFKPVIDLESIPELSWFESFETSLWECCPDWVSIQIHERKSKKGLGIGYASWSSGAKEP